MTHFITADLPDGTEVELSYGTSRHTLDAMSATGFDFYESYEAWGCNGGSSGSGKTIDISPEIAEQAFRAALAWVLAVRQTITPEMAAQDPSTVGEGVQAWKLLGGSLEELLQEIGDPIPADVSDRDREAVADAASKIAQEIRNAPLDSDECERVLTSLGMVMDFTWAVYRGTRSGPATMSFY